jgi:hypothetical protein
MRGQPTALGTHDDGALDPAHGADTTADDVPAAASPDDYDPAADYLRTLPRPTTVICEYRWWAPRGDAPASMDVQHVCMLQANHYEPHRCSCKATKGAAYPSDYP